MYNGSLTAIDIANAKYRCWNKQFMSHLKKMNRNKIDNIIDLSQSELIKIGLAGIKFMCASLDVLKETEKRNTDCVKSVDEAKYELPMTSNILNILSLLTLKNFVTTFPIDKVYNGKKRGSKDFFSTMNYLSKMNWDKPIGLKELLELLLEYQNCDLRRVYKSYLACVNTYMK